MSQDYNALNLPYPYQGTHLNREQVAANIRRIGGWVLLDHRDDSVLIANARIDELVGARGGSVVRDRQQVVSISVVVGDGVVRVFTAEDFPMHNYRFFYSWDGGDHGWDSNREIPEELLEALGGVFVELSGVDFGARPVAR